MMSQFKSGQEKPTGSYRKRGTPNRKSKVLDDIFDFNGFSVPEQLLKVLPELSPRKAGGYSFGSDVVLVP